MLSLRSSLRRSALCATESILESSLVVAAAPVGADGVLPLLVLFGDGRPDPGEGRLNWFGASGDDVAMDANLKFNFTLNTGMIHLRELIGRANLPQTCTKCSFPLF